eukprot:10658189-Alexandrium_andersonii.AAC.1
MPTGARASRDQRSRTGLRATALTARTSCELAATTRAPAPHRLANQVPLYQRTSKLRSDSAGRAMWCTSSPNSYPSSRRCLPKSRSWG